MEKTKENLIHLFKKTAKLMELQGENPFKTKSYQTGARNLELADLSLKELIEKNKISNIKGIGDALKAKAIEFYQTGSISFYEELLKNTDQGLIDFSELSGIGPKKARFLYYDLGAKSLGELEYACIENRLVKLKGFGEKTQAKILDAIVFKKSHLGEKLLSEAFHEADQILEVLNKKFKAYLVGDLRRYLETISKIEFLVLADDLNSLKNYLSPQNFISNLQEKSPQELSAISKHGLPISFYLSDQACLGNDLVFKTGSKEHLKNLLALAEEKKVNLQTKNYASEENLYQSLGLQFIPPELREGFNEIDLSLKNQIPELVELKDLQGCYHAHSTYSDGKNSILEMANACQDYGLSYLGLSDHSQTAVYAHGLKPADIEKQHQEIDQLNAKLKDFKILKGIESDILKDGSLDYDNKILEKFDFVIASIHQRFNSSKDEMTDRIITALKNPFTTMLGHLSGRLLLARKAYEIDMDEILKTAKAENKIIEINANPHRLDMDWRYLSKAKKLGIKISINPDAHSIHGFKDLKYGIMMARKGELTKDDIVNISSQ